MVHADNLLPTLLAAYDLAPPISSFALEHAGLNNANLGVRTVAGDFVVRIYKSLCYQDAASIAYENDLLIGLSERGKTERGGIERGRSFALPVPIPTRDGGLGFDGPTGWTALTPKLPGAPLARQRHDPALLGATIGEIHAALCSYPNEPRPGRPLFGELFQFGRPTLNAPRLRPEHLGLDPGGPNDALFGWWRDESAKLESFVAGSYRDLPWQLCHNDVTPNNVLAQDGVVTGLLDFEFATPGPSVMDFVTGLRMAMQFWRLDPPWDDLRRFCQGYARWLGLDEDEQAAIPALLRLRSAITVLWWIGRAAATGEAGPIPERIEAAQKMVRWLDHHEAVLLALIEEEVIGQAGERRRETG